jgi:transposase InsO family protein
MAKTAGRRERRRFTNEFKAGVVRLVLDEGKTAGAVARELDLTDSAVRAWVAQAEADRTKGKTGLTTAEREELARLRKENRELKLERDIPKSTTMSDHDQPVAANLLNREFTAAAPNQRWVGDTTEFVVGSSGKLYLAVILDLFSRFVVGWAVSAVNDRHLAIRALDAALKRRCPDSGLLHHSDQGSPYASEDYQKILEAQGITCSMSRRGNCYDNAVMESFFSTVKSELADRFESFAEAKRELFDYLEVFYNQRRRHSTLGQVSPAAFEKTRVTQAA